jgi:3-methyl-2-oxobutanoate hydroxymethyltransferase
MPSTEPRKFTIADLRAARDSGRKVPILTCYDYPMARLMQEAGVPALLVGDSAASVILGHDSTLPATLDFMIELTAAVRRGAPRCLVIADMPFASYHASASQAFKSIARMVQLSGCDCVKIEAAASHAGLIGRLADAGVAVIAHLGLRPQAIGILGGYKARGRSAVEAEQIVALSARLARAGATAILLEAVPPEVSAAVVEAIGVPVIGCGAGPACHGHVFVTHDALGLTAHRPKFVPPLGDLATPMLACFREYVRMVESGKYPASEHWYEMGAEEKRAFGAMRVKSAK